MTRLSKNFTLTEFTKSQTALRQGIDNTPGEEHLETAKKFILIDQTRHLVIKIKE